jgi:hypothetical protein
LVLEGGNQTLILEVLYHAAHIEGHSAGVKSGGTVFEISTTYGRCGKTLDMRILFRYWYVVTVSEVARCQNILIFKILHYSI